MSTEGRELVYVGTSTRDNGSEGIYLCARDEATGNLEILGAGPQVESPTYLATHPNKRYIYACNSLGVPGPEGSVYSLSIDPESHRLQLLNEVSARGPGPCHVNIDRGGRFVMSANFWGGSICVHPVLDDGRLGDACDFHQHEGSSVMPGRQDVPHAHSIWPDPTGRYALVCDLGLDKVIVYGMDLEQGKLLPSRSPYVRIKPAAGPRHIDFHPNGRWVYLISELTSAVTLLEWHADMGVLSEVCHVPSLPEGFEGANTAADIHVTPDGRFVYATNRGHNSVAMFAIDQESGLPELQGYESTQGDHPRNFCIDPTGKWLFVANMNTNNIVTFAINGQTGALEATGFQLQVPGACCIKFLNA